MNRPVCCRCGLPGIRYALLDIGTGCIRHPENWMCEAEKKSPRNLLAGTPVTVNFVSAGIRYEEAR